MKLVFNYLTLFTFIILSISACNKKDDVNLIDENNKWILLDSTNSANLKIVHVFAGNTPIVPTAQSVLTGPQVFVYANSNKLNGTSLGYINGTTFTGTSTTPNALGFPWPTPNVYANVPSGNIKFEIINARLNLAVVPNLPSFQAGDTLSTLNTVLEKGKYYTLYISDTVPTVRTFIKEDILTAPNYQNYKIRLANMMMNIQDTLTLFSRRQNAEIISDISHKNISDWIQLPLPVISDTLELRKKGSSLTYITVIGNGSGAVPPPAFTPIGQRMYTVLARGKNGINGKAPSASLIVNR